MSVSRQSFRRNHLANHSRSTGSRSLRATTAAATLAIATLVSLAPATADESTAADPPAAVKAVIGATADVLDAASGLTFRARVDTGAHSCSIHAERWEVEGEAGKMSKNVGKKIRVLLRNKEGEQSWIETSIADAVSVKTSEDRERRYKVWLTLTHGDVERRVAATLNDRSHMSYALLLGRNFLRGRFVVDVEKKFSPNEPAAAEG